MLVLRWLQRDETWSRIRPVQPERKEQSEDKGVKVDGIGTPSGKGHFD